MRSLSSLLFLLPSPRAKMRKIAEVVWGDLLELWAKQDQVARAG